MKWLLLILLVLTALEIGVFIWIGGMIGPWWIVLIIILTGVIGIMLAKQQGIDTWNKAMNSIEKGYAPTEYVIDGICIFIGAVFLFTPGFITDAAGLLLILPITRKPFKASILKLVKRLMEKNTIIFRRW